MMRKKEGTLLSSGSPALCKSAALRLQHARRTNRLPSQDFILTPSSRSRSMKKGARNCSMTVLPLAQKYEGYFSNTIPDSDISKINDAGGAPVTVHDETIELLKTGISYGDLSGGKFDITIGRLSDLWDISTKALLDQTDVSMIPPTRTFRRLLPQWITGRFRLTATQ